MSKKNGVKTTITKEWIESVADTLQASGAPFILLGKFDDGKGEAVFMSCNGSMNDLTALVDETMDDEEHLVGVFAPAVMHQMVKKSMAQAQVELAKKKGDVN